AVSQTTAQTEKSKNTRWEKKKKKTRQTTQTPPQNPRRTANSPAVNIEANTTGKVTSSTILKKSRGIKSFDCKLSLYARTVEGPNFLLRTSTIHSSVINGSSSAAGAWVMSAEPMVRLAISSTSHGRASMVAATIEPPSSRIPATPPSCGTADFPKKTRFASKGGRDGPPRPPGGVFVRQSSSAEEFLPPAAGHPS